VSSIAPFLAKFDPPMARRIRACRAALRKRLPTAHELVYDNYNFFVIGYGPNERASDAVVSIAARAVRLQRARPDHHQVNFDKTAAPAVIEPLPWSSLDGRSVQCA